MESENTYSKEWVEQSLLRIFVHDTVDPPPLQKDEELKEWKIRFKHIGLQKYCYNCREWRTWNYDYCHECGADFYSHVDLTNNEMAPVRRSTCSGCMRAIEDFNGALKCKKCFLELKGMNPYVGKVEHTKESIRKNNEEAIKRLFMNMKNGS